MSKKSIRFFNDREVRAVWDDENNKWWFSATDIVRAINNEDDYVKAGNYWRWLKKKLNTEGVQLVSATHDFKLKKRLGLCVDWSQVGKKDYLNAMIESQTDSTHIKQLLEQALTDKINDRETFMKGIDYSYYYEQEE